MAVCDWCHREMTAAKSCSVAVLHRDGVPIGMVPWGKEHGWRAAGRCGDCGVRPGRFHHPGCDVQQCPVCRGQMFGCGCRFDEDGPQEEEGEVLDLAIDSNGNPTERKMLGGQEVVIHYTDAIPDSDITTVCGIRVTTPLRTVIDIAPDVDDEQLRRIVDDCLRRHLFTVEEARARLTEPDMRERPGTERLCNLLLD